jgi:hypothetical protein
VSQTWRRSEERDLRDGLRIEEDGRVHKDDRITHDLVAVNPSTIYVSRFIRQLAAEADHLSFDHLYRNILASKKQIGGAGQTVPRTLSVLSARITATVQL